MLSPPHHLLITWPTNYVIGPPHGFLLIYNLYLLMAHFDQVTCVTDALLRYVFMIYEGNMCVC